MRLLDNSKFVAMENGHKPLSPATTVIHGHDPNLWSWRPVILPIVNSTNYLYDSLDFNTENGYSYARSANPTANGLQISLARLEDAKHALAFSSGMASVVAIVQLLKPGDHIVCSDVIYGGVSHYFSKYCLNQGFDVSFVDFKYLENVSKFKTLKNVKLVWTECLLNPTLEIVDIPSVAKLVRELAPEAIFCVDNTFLTPCFLKCLANGADVVMNSLTKFINGHGDVIMGSLATNNDDLYEKLNNVKSSMGFTPSPFDCYLVSRSLKTIRIRMREHERNALQVAQFLEKHHSVEKVLYPGLESHPQHELAKSFLHGFGGMVAFYVKGKRTEIETFVLKLKVVLFCASLGLAESIISYPWTMSHFHVAPEEKIRHGITENLVRMSVGLEDAQDLISDLDQALP